MYLDFALPMPPTLDAVRAIFAAIAAILAGRPVAWEPRARSDLPSPPGCSGCFAAEWGDGECVLSERVEGGSGDPRDGYGYASTWDLRVPAGGSVARARASAGGWEPVPSRMTIELSGAPPGIFSAARAALRGLCGVERDGTAASAYARSTVEMLDRGGEREVALALARESVALSGPAAYGRAELVDWLERAAPGPDALGTRLREAPVLVEGWLEAERTPPEGMARDFVVGMVAQLFPFDPGRWEAAGLPHAPWFSHPCWPLAGPPTTPDRAAPRSSWHRAAIPASHVLPSFPAELAHAVTGWVSGADWQGHDAEPGANDESGWRWTVTRWARWREGASRPTVRVELRASHRPSSPEKKRGGASATGAVDELICWNWFAGDEPGDALLLVQRDRRAGRRGSPGPYGAGWCVVGTDAFRVRAEAAIARCSPWRWEACAPEESLEPFPVTPVLPGVDTRGAPLEAAAASLDAALLPDDERSRVLELLSCRCVHPGIGFCAHRAELLDRTRAHRSLSQAAPTVRERTLARVAEAALEAAFYAAGANPNPESVHRAVERVRMELTTLAGLR